MPKKVMEMVYENPIKINMSADHNLKRRRTVINNDQY